MDLSTWGSMQKLLPSSLLPFHLSRHPIAVSLALPQIVSKSLGWGQASSSSPTWKRWEESAMWGGTVSRAQPR